MAAPVIEVSELTRTYRSGGLFSRSRKEVQAVRGISFAVRRGELFGLLGPNGAGKTTTIKMLMTLLLPTSGSARVLGLDVVKDAQAVRRKVGYVFGGDRGLYERLSGLDNLRYFAELYGVPPKIRRQESASFLNLSASTAARRNGWKATRGACGSGCTSRGVCCTGASVAAIGAQLGIEAGLGLLYSVLGLATLFWLENESKRKSTLDIN